MGSDSFRRAAVEDELVPAAARKETEHFGSEARADIGNSHGRQGGVLSLCCFLIRIISHTSNCFFSRYRHHLRHLGLLPDRLLSCWHPGIELLLSRVVLLVRDLRRIRLCCWCGWHVPLRLTVIRLRLVPSLRGYWLCHGLRKVRLHFRLLLGVQIGVVVALGLG